MIRMRFSRVGRIAAGVAAVILLTAYVLKPPALIDARSLALVYAVGLIAALAFAGLIRMGRKR